MPLNESSLVDSGRVSLGLSFEISQGFIGLATTISFFLDSLLLSIELDVEFEHPAKGTNDVKSKIVNNFLITIEV